MQITHLKMVIEECTRDLGDEGAVKVEGYYHHKASWWALATSAEVDDGLIAQLDRCLNTGGPYRTTNSKWANFALTDLRAVVRAEFGAPLRTATLDAIQRVVLRGHRNASNEFAAKYNGMTGLLAKTAFQQTVEQRLNALVVPDAGTTEVRATETSPPALCLLALDIDHFKQVNDSYGHAYGDLVLRAFAMRFERTVSQFCRNKPTRIQATCAHVSGEEFFCVAWGEADTREFEELAESILEAVRDSVLPSDSEVERLRSSTPNVDLSIPPMSNRRITCSIGGVIHGVPTSRDRKISAAKLINQADVALYKSKNQGRDRTTFFATILQNGGRIIEYRSDVRICILDIGSDIGVAKGQEFLVFHPEFTGKNPYVLDDGRSRKVLGKLPRVPLCTITAFDVQRDISFCRISDERYLQTPIPANAALEAIPLGTLSTGVVTTGAIWAADESITSVASIAETHQRITGKVDPADELSFVVVGIKNESQLLSDHGTAAVNRALAAACRHLQKIAEGGFLGQIETTKLLIQLKSFSANHRENVDAALERAEKDNGGRAKFVAGVYAGDVGRTEDEAELPKIGDIRSRADLARYAASPEGMLEDARVQIFSHDTALQILSRLLKTREFKRGLADYERFTEIGMAGADLSNCAGLLAYSSSSMQQAETFFLRAVDQAPASEIVYRLNLLTSQLHQSNYAVAARTADTIDIAVLEKEYRTFPFGTVCFAIAIAERALATSGANAFSFEMTWLERALDMEKLEAWRARLQSLMSRLAQKASLQSP